MKVHVFESGKKRRTYGFTQDAASANLPSDLAPWSYLKTIDIQRNQPRVGAGSEDVLAGIDKDGYFVTSVTFNFVTTFNPEPDMPT